MFDNLRVYRLQFMLVRPAMLLLLLKHSAVAGSVMVTTDSATYAGGDPIEVTIDNNSGDRITRVVYAYTDVDTRSQEVSVSDPFDVTS